MPEPLVSHIRHEVRDRVTVVTLNRPGALNAFTDRMEYELVACLDRADADDGVRAVVLTGAGRAFCAGMDLPRPTPKSSSPGGLARPRHPAPVRRRR